MNIKLDDYEQDLLDSYEQDEWQSVDNLKAEIKLAKLAAENTLKKDKRISIRVYGSDLLRLKRLAAKEGLPYQTFITSLLHKFSTGQIKVE